MSAPTIPARQEHAQALAVATVCDEALRVLTALAQHDLRTPIIAAMADSKDPGEMSPVLAAVDFLTEKLPKLRTQLQGARDVMVKSVHSAKSLQKFLRKAPSVSQPITLEATAYYHLQPGAPGSCDEYGQKLEPDSDDDVAIERVFVGDCEIDVDLLSKKDLDGFEELALAECGEDEPDHLNYGDRNEQVQ